MLNVVKMFVQTVTHFQTREGAIKSLAVTVAIERWIQFELATLQT